MMDQQPQQAPPSEPKPGMSGAAGPGEASPAAMGVKGSRGKMGNIDAVRAELRRGANALATALYQNEKTSAAILKILNPQEKIDTAAKAAVLATTQVAEKTGLAERVIPSLAAMAVDEVISMAKAQGTEYSEEDSKNVLMATQEMVLSAYGVEEGRARQLAEQASPEEQQKVEKIYQQGEQQDG